jgi:hypothetical protein
VSTDREEIIAHASQKHIFAGDTPDQHAAVGKLADGDSRPEIRPRGIVRVIRIH